MRLGGQNLVSSAKEVPKEELQKNRERIKFFESLVSANLGQATLSIRDLLELKIGDVVILEKRLNEDIDIYVEEELKFTGRAGLLGKYKAVEILKRLYKEEIEVYDGTED